MESLSEIPVRHALVCCRLRLWLPLLRYSVGGRKVTTENEEIELITLALTDEDLDRVWVCIRHCRQQLEPDHPDQANLQALERLVASRT